MFAFQHEPSQPSNMSQVEILQVEWASAHLVLHSIRYPVFVLEQGFAAEIELDGRDPDCVHILARRDTIPVGTARMLPTGHIGRVSVLATYRGHGIGSALIRKLMRIAQEQGQPHVDLDSQIHAIPFYERLGFERNGPVFQEAGKPHQNMVARF